MQSERAMLTRCCSPPEKVAGGSDHSLAGMPSTPSRNSARRRASSALMPSRMAGSATTSIVATRGITRRNWLTKPRVRRRTSSTVRGSARTSSTELAVMADADRAGIGAIVAVERAQQRALAGARRADQRQALARRDGERHVAQHGQREVALGMHDEGFGEAGDAERGHRHTGRIEATSIWV